ncbi:UNVERIFIED_CONTAM: hypothetical protein NCL1_49785 [Trichonephila clavipes]
MYQHPREDDRFGVMGNACGHLSGLVSLAIRSGISKIADKDELGNMGLCHSEKHRIFSSAYFDSINMLLDKLKLFLCLLRSHPNREALFIGNILCIWNSLN